MKGKYKVGINEMRKRRYEKSKRRHGVEIWNVFGK